MTFDRNGQSPTKALLYALSHKGVVYVGIGDRSSLAFLTAEDEEKNTTDTKGI